MIIIWPCILWLHFRSNSAALNWEGLCCQLKQSPHLTNPVESVEGDRSPPCIQPMSEFIFDSYISPLDWYHFNFPIVESTTSSERDVSFVHGFLVHGRWTSSYVLRITASLNILSSKFYVLRNRKDSSRMWMPFHPNFIDDERRNGQHTVMLSINFGMRELSG